VVNREEPRRETYAGLPYLTEDDINAFDGEKRDFDHDLSLVEDENPELAADIRMMRAAEDIDNPGLDILKIRHVMAAGAVRMYMMLHHKATANKLASMQESLASSDGGADGADPLPST